MSQNQLEFVLQQAGQLSERERLQLIKRLVETLEKKPPAAPPLPPTPETTKRIPGLHAGMVWISDDFDDPLPDEFWLGEE